MNGRDRFFEGNKPVLSNPGKIYPRQQLRILEPPQGEYARATTGLMLARINNLLPVVV
jgi:hypothetical protein